MALTSRGLLRLFLFLGGYVIFLILGATVFSAIESPEELQKVQSLRNLRSEFLKNHPSVTEEIESSREAARIRYENTKTEAENIPRHDITLREAMRILDIDKLDPVDVEKRFKHLFELNSRSNGGTLYLQSKIFRAKQRLDYELKKQIAKLPQSQTNQTATKT